MAMDEKGLGKRLQLMRQRAGMTQQQLCLAANLSFSTLTKIERGAIKAPSIFTIQSIASALGMGLDDLLDFEAPQAKGRITKSGVRFVYFDVNGCLARFYHRAYIQIAQDYSLPADLVEMAFLHYNADVCSGKISMTEFNRSIAKRLGIAKLDWAKYYLANIEPMPGMAETVRWASQHYGVGLLTNVMPGILDELMDKKIIPDIKYDAIIDSSKAGLVKPDQAIFELALKKANLPPECLMLVDDSRENIAVAEKKGWHVMLFDYAEPDMSVDQVRLALEFD